MQEGMGKAGAGGDNREVCGLRSIGHPIMGRTHSKVL